MRLPENNMAVLVFAHNVHVTKIFNYVSAIVEDARAFALVAEFTRSRTGPFECAQKDCMLC